MTISRIGGPNFAKDCKELTYLSPTSFFEEDLKAAEHVFGLREE
ncbi:hypothetical protein [Spirosoma profusum]|nr:hypothetical protein [Spirosoma profusum]